MASSISLNSQSSNTGANTANPQTISTNSSIGGGFQSPQSSIYSNSIYSTSTAVPIPLQSSDNLTTSSVQPTNTSSNSSHLVYFIPVMIILVIAIVWGVYIYVSSNSKKKYQDN